MAAAATASGKDYLTEELAQELLDLIIGYLDLSNQLKLRLVFNAPKADKVTRTLEPVLSNLFVSPTRLSLRNFKNICQAPFFQEYVRTVTFVPYEVSKADLVFRDDVASDDALAMTACEHYRRQASHNGTDLTRREAQRSLELYNSLSVEHEVYYKFARKSSKLRSSQELCAILRRGLESLPRLGAVILSFSINRDGLNASCAAYGEEYNQRRSFLGQYTLDQDVVGRAANLFLGSRDYTGHADVFFEAIDSASIRLRTLNIGEEGNDGQLGILICDSSTLEGLMKRLRNLTVSVMRCPGSLDTDLDLNWQKIACSATGLRKLTIMPEVDPYNEDGSLRTSSEILEYFLRFGHYPSLQLLRVKGTREQPATAKAMDVIDFFSRHCETLEHVDFSGMLFDSTSVSEDVCAATRSVLDHALVMPKKLKTFKMQLYRRDEHSNPPSLCQDEECLREGGPCDGSCEEYLDFQGEWFHRSKLEDLASELGIVLKDDCWDFGQYVMRNRT